MNVDLILAGIQQGLLLAFIALGVMIPFRILQMPDLTAEGAYPLGSAVCAMLLILGLHPSIALFCGVISGGLIGYCAGFLHLRLKINLLLAGIILSTMTYSVNLRIIGKPNISLFNCLSFFSANRIEGNILILLATVALIIVFLYLFLNTEIGLKLRTVGLNRDFALRQGISISKYTLLGLFLANALSGLGGGLMGQHQSYMDVGMGQGIVIHALAALMIGETLLGHETLKKQLIAPLLGALVYQQLQGLALSLGLAPSDLKFFTAFVVIMVIAMKRRPQYA